MTPPIHFKSAFWSQKQPELNLPDFYTGFNILHQKLGQSRVENEELIAFFKDRISIEDYYASRLLDQGRSNFKASGFGRDEGATLSQCFSRLKESTQEFGNQHKSTANSIASQVLTPLQEFHEEYKRNVANSKQAIESMLKQFEGATKEAEKARTYYHKKSRDADKAESLALKSLEKEPPKTVEKESVETETSSSTTNTHNVQLGNQVMTKQEFNNLVRQMKKEITMIDHRVPILGTYKNTSTGEDIAIWLQHNLPQCKDSPAMADIVGQQLLQPYNVLRLIGQRGNKFVAASTNFYQWRLTGEEDETASISSESTYNALGGLLEKISAQSNGSEEPHKKARRDAEKADEAYRQTVVKLDQMRMAIEQAIFAHLSEMEQVELNRIEKLKQAVSSFIAALSTSVPLNKQIIEKMVTFQDDLKPDQDIQAIIRQYTVSSFSPKAIVYDNFYHGVSKDQVFGVLLEDLSEQEEDRVPKFISALLQSLENKMDRIEASCWSTPVALDKVHSACAELNVPSDTISTELFDNYEPDLLVAVLRYFLLELPECLLTYEFYDAIEALLGGKVAEDTEKNELHLTSFTNLIATLPASHFATLKVLFAHITKFIEKLNVPQDTVKSICQSLGPVILRPRVESFSTISSTLPARFTNELVQHYDTIFSESTIRLHLESEKRRLAKPIVAQSEQPSEAVVIKRGNSLMGFMRPTINTADKWIFQRNNTQSPTTNNTTVEMPKTSVPLSFGSLITLQASPPSSPIVAVSKNDIQDVMFDGSGIFDQEEAEEEKKLENIEPTDVYRTNEQMDSSFFDDDDE